MSDDKLKSLDDRIDEAKQTSTIAPPPAEPAMHNNPGARAGGEFVANVIAGAILGWLIDHFFHTTPIGIASMIFLGFGFGIYRANKVLTSKYK